MRVIFWSFFVICIYNNKEHNGQLIDQDTIVVRTYPVRWNAPNRRTVVQPRMQISKLQTYRHTLSSEQIQACRPAGVKNYMLADALILFFFLPFPFSLFCFVVFFGKITQGYRHAGIEQYKTWCLFFFKWNTSLTPYTGVIKPQACRHTGNKTTNVPPHRRNTKLQACRPTGIYKTTSFKLTATQATKLLLRFFFFLFFFRRHTGVVQNYKLAAPQA